MKVIIAFLLITLVACIWAIDQKLFAKECLKRHNLHRKKHHAPPLVLDDDVNEGALKWANKIARLNVMKHHGSYGENIFAVFGSSIDVESLAKTAVDAWYNEVKLYNFNNGGFSSRTGHFTQLVWKNSKRLGCAVAKSSGGFYVVARYDPRGNSRGGYAENVLRP